MNDTIRQVDYYYVQVPDRPGEAFKILGRLKEAGVNLLAFTAFPIEGGKTQLDFVPENAEAFSKVIKEMGAAVSARKQAFLVQGRERVGAIADTFKRLSEAGINVHAANASCAGAGGYGMILWVKPQHHAPACKALGI